MSFPKSSNMAFYSRLVEIYPDLLRTAEEALEITDEPDSDPLREPAPDYDRDAPADLVIENALLSGANAPQDIAIREGVITRIGDAYKICTSDTTIVNARGGLVFPGFCDSHLHLLSAAQQRRGCDMEDISTTEEFRQRLSSFAHENPDVPVLYVYGLHYLDPPLIPSESARHTLDEIIADRPALVFAHDLHTAWANTRALEIAGFLHTMPPYPPLMEMLDLDGNIMLGPDGIASGEFREPEVYFLVEGALRSKYPVSVENQLHDIREACQDLARRGFTSVHRMGLSHPIEDLSFLLMVLELEQQGDLLLRIQSSISTIADQAMLDDVRLAHRVRRALTSARHQEITAAALHDILVKELEAVGTRRHSTLEVLTVKYGKEFVHLHAIREWSRLIHDVGYRTHILPHRERDNPHHRTDFPNYLHRDSRVRCDTVKIFMDGVIEKDTAYRLDQEPVAGIPEFSQAELDSLVLLADRLGVKVAAHSIGDASVRSMLDAISRARGRHHAVDKERGHQIPHRIEHIELCTPEDIPRFGREGVVASMQPLHERPPTTLWHTKIPRDKWDTAFAWRDLSDSGAVLIFGSDWPIVSCDIGEGVHHAVTRGPWTDGGRNQSIPISCALDAYTRNAAFTEYASMQRGRVAEGMVADLVILRDDVERLEQTDQLEICMTICRGSITYDAYQAGD
ncbi:MAG: amidohydrolase family protein [Euryarchaeota archaeon]|nr:amidohydrolase family protein [Euryarchaeota archaeon]